MLTFDWFRFLPSRRFPDKAIDLLDDAAARLKLDRPPISNSNPNSKADLSSEVSELLVGEQNIAQVVSTTTGIPLSVLQKHGATTLGAGETELLELEQKLGRAVIGQKLAVSAVCNALRVAKAGLGRVDRPLGVFLLLGGSGVGKTELAKRVSQQLFPIGGGERSGLSGSESESVDVAEERGAMLRIDMSEVYSIRVLSRANIFEHYRALYIIIISCNLLCNTAMLCFYPVRKRVFRVAPDRISARICWLQRQVCMYTVGDHLVSLITHHPTFIQVWEWRWRPLDRGCADPTLSSCASG